MKKRYFLSLIITLGILAMTNKFWLILKTTHHVYFEFYIFTIILICGYLLSLKLTEYLADFKNLKHQSRIEIIFLTIFFILLFIPMSHIDTKTIISEKENRTLAKYKPLIEKNNINFSYGKNFNDWFNDRFLFRINIITIYNKLQCNTIVSTREGIFNTKTNWMFKKHLLSNKKTLNTKFKENIIKTLDKFNEFCNVNNIKLYVLIVPYQDEIYNEKKKPYSNKQKVINTNNMIYEIQNKSKAKIIYPFNKLKKESEKEFVYFKTDWHWTDIGAYIGYQELMREIKKDFPNIISVNINDYKISESNKIRSDWDRKYHEGEIFMHLFPFYKNNTNKILDTKYKYLTNKNQNLLKTQVINISKKREKNFYYPYGNNITALQIGTSMNENLTQFTPYTFNNLKYIRIIQVKDIPDKDSYKIIKLYKNEILDYKPNIIILCLTPQNLVNIHNFFKD